MHCALCTTQRKRQQKRQFYNFLLEQYFLTFFPNYLKVWPIDSKSTFIIVTLQRYQKLMSCCSPRTICTLLEKLCTAKYSMSLPIFDIKQEVLYILIYGIGSKTDLLEQLLWLKK